MLLSAQKNDTKFRKCDISKAKVKGHGDISTSFVSSSGLEAKGLPNRYAEIKKQLVKNPVALTNSWIKLKKALHNEISEIKRLGHHSIPSIDFSEIDNLSEDKRENVLKRGVFIVKDVIPRKEAEAYKNEVLDYVNENPTTWGFPKDSPVVYELYWSKPQLKARSHPNLRRVTKFANNLWHASNESDICLDQNVSYADRLSIRNPGDTNFSLGPHVDSGSLERWEDPEYSQCFSSIFNGLWEDYDPYDATHRILADMCLYESTGNCSMFRTFQAYLGISEISPNIGGMKFAPSVKLVTAYYMLKPFFDNNDQIKYDSEIPGAFPGKGLDLNDDTHSELKLDDIMVSVPKVEPGDMVFWHCDLVHSVDSTHKGNNDSSVLYIPSAPLCKINATYAFLQREAFLQGLAAPDFPGFPKGIAETMHKGRGTPKDIEKSGGDGALREFCLVRFKNEPEYSEGAQRTISYANQLLFN